MRVNQYFLGSTIIIFLQIQDSQTLAPVDPGALDMKILSPLGAETTYTYGDSGSPIVKTATGQYSIPITLNNSGTWYYRWEASGANPGVYEGSISVLSSPIVSG